MADVVLKEHASEHFNIQVDGASRASNLKDMRRLPISYDNLRYSVRIKDTKTKTWVDKDILKGLTGVIKPARLTAVMGASGAGKTTLLNLLSGYPSAGATSSGTITVAGHSITPEKMRAISGFVHQEDVIMDTMTVREALTFAAMLRLPESLPRETKMQRALDVAELLGLTHALDTSVGSAMIKGISGGEKRRLSLGMEMITNPAILFLDEPTSGLDTFKAYKVTKILASLAGSYGRTVCATIHQPSSEIYQCFDDLVLLADGHVIYHGPASTAVSYFTTLGFACPRYTNPADYLFMDVLNAGYKNHEAGYDMQLARQATSKFESDEQQRRVQELVKAWPASQQAEQLLQDVAAAAEPQGDGLGSEVQKAQVSFPLQFALLAQRCAMSTWRNPLNFKGRLAQTVFLSLVFGLIFLRLGNDMRGVQSRQGSLFFLNVQSMFGSVLAVLTIFGSEKAVFKREYGSRMYNMPSFFLSRWFVNLPTHIFFPLLMAVIVYWMIGYQNLPVKFFWLALVFILVENCGASIGMFTSCVFNNIEVALAVMPMFLLPLMVFSGFFVNSNSIPPWFYWIQFLSPMRYGFIALAKNEFSGLQIDCQPGQNCRPGITGDDILTAMSFDDKGSIEENSGILFAIMWGFLLLAYVMLWINVRKLVNS